MIRSLDNNVDLNSSRRKYKPRKYKKTKQMTIMGWPPSDHHVLEEAEKSSPERKKQIDTNLDTKIALSLFQTPSSIAVLTFAKYFSIYLIHSIWGFSNLNRSIAWN